MEQIARDYAAGKLLTGEVKKRLGDVVAEVVKHHQEARAEIDDATVRRFMDPTREETRKGRLSFFSTLAFSRAFRVVLWI